MRWDFRYQREEANIEAWVNLQSAKAEAESRKLEVAIYFMCSRKLIKAYSCNLTPEFNSISSAYVSSNSVT